MAEGVCNPGWENGRAAGVAASAGGGGKARARAAQSEPDYVYALPERYRQKWERSGIGERVQEVTRQARTSLKARLSFTPEKHVEAAVRKECGGEAQRLDREMREEMQQDRRLWDVLHRMDTLQDEQAQALAGPSRTESPTAQLSKLQPIAG